MPVKQVLHEAEPQIPLQRLRQHLPLPLLLRHEALEQAGQRHAQVKELLVKERDEVVLLPEDAVRDVMRVELGGGRVVRVAGVLGGDGGEGVLFADGADAADDFGPRDGLNVGLD